MAFIRKFIALLVSVQIRQVGRLYNSSVPCLQKVLVKESPSYGDILDEFSEDLIKESLLCPLFFCC